MMDLAFAKEVADNAELRDDFSEDALKYVINELSKADMLNDNNVKHYENELEKLRKELAHIESTWMPPNIHIAMMTKVREESSNK